MKKIIFTLLTAFFACSMAVNAQNSSNLLDNPYLLELNQQLQKVEIKLQTAATQAEIDDLNQAKAEIQQKMDAFEQNVASRTSNSQSRKGTLEKQSKQIQPNRVEKSKLKTKQASILKKQATLQAQKEDLAAKAKQMNLDFAKKKLPFKTRIKTFKGKQYIQIVDLPLQNGMMPKNVNQ